MSVDRTALRARLRALFLDELDEHVLVLNRGLIALEQGSAGSEAADLVNQLFRSAHSLKGAAHAAAVEPVATLCHGLEAALARLRDSPGEAGGTSLQPLFRAVDTLDAAGRRLRDGVEVTDLPVAGIVRSLSTGGGEPGPEPRLQEPAIAPSADPGPGARGAVHAEPAPPRASDRVTHGTRVPAARLEALLAGAGEVLLACEAMHVVAAEAASPEAAAVDRLLTSAERALTDAMRQVGMVPFGEACAGIDRVVRDVSRAAAKQARLVVLGGEVEIDRPILESLREPLMHLVRNAVDHGIESPEARLAAGKEATGTVTVQATLQGTRVAVTVSDDGAGVDAEAVRAAAARRGIAQVEDLDADDVLLDLVFVPGLSTAPILTEVSGRGVGLDAVRAAVEAVGGTVAIESAPGAGSRVTLLVPVTRSVVRVLLVAAGGEVVALPTSGIARLARARAEDLRVTDDRTMLLLGGCLLPVAWLADGLGLEPVGGPAGSSLQGVVVETPTGQAVLVVDELLAEQEAVIKPPPPRLAGLPGLLGATILPSGRVVLVLNPATSVRVALDRARRLAPPAPGEEPARPRRVLLVDDTLTTRTLERSILETAGYEVVAAVDGLNALELLQAPGQLEVDAVVSDVNMPRMDGLTLCQSIRSSTRFGHLPFVLVTSLASEDDRRRGVEAGADAYIAKSEFDQSMLLDTLSRLL